MCSRDIGTDYEVAAFAMSLSRLLHVLTGFTCKKRVTYKTIVNKGILGKTWIIKLYTRKCASACVKPVIIQVQDVPNTFFTHESLLSFLCFTHGHKHRLTQLFCFCFLFLFYFNGVFLQGEGRGRRNSLTLLKSGN